MGALLERGLERVTAPPQQRPPESPPGGARIRSPGSGGSRLNGSHFARDPPSASTAGERDRELERAVRGVPRPDPRAGATIVRLKPAARVDRIAAMPTVRTCRLGAASRMADALRVSTDGAPSRASD